MTAPPHSVAASARAFLAAVQRAAASSSSSSLSSSASTFSSVHLPQSKWTEIAKIHLNDCGAALRYADALSRQPQSNASGSAAPPPPPPPSFSSSTSNPVVAASAPIAAPLAPLPIEFTVEEAAFTLVAVASAANAAGEDDDASAGSRAQGAAADANTFLTGNPWLLTCVEIVCDAALSPKSAAGMSPLQLAQVLVSAFRTLRIAPEHPMGPPAPPATDVAVATTPNWTLAAELSAKCRHMHHRVFSKLRRALLSLLSASASPSTSNSISSNGTTLPAVVELLVSTVLRSSPLAEHREQQRLVEFLGRTSVREALFACGGTMDALTLFQLFERVYEVPAAALSSGFCNTALHNGIWFHPLFSTVLEGFRHAFTRTNSSSSGAAAVRPDHLIQIALLLSFPRMSGSDGPVFTECPAITATLPATSSSSAASAPQVASEELSSMCAMLLDAYRAGVWVSRAAFAQMVANSNNGSSSGCCAAVAVSVCVLAMHCRSKVTDDLDVMLTDVGRIAVAALDGNGRGGQIVLGHEPLLLPAVTGSSSSDPSAPAMVSSRSGLRPRPLQFTVATAAFALLGCVFIAPDVQSRWIARFRMLGKGGGSDNSDECGGGITSYLSFNKLLRFARSPAFQAAPCCSPSPPRDASAPASLVAANLLFGDLRRKLHAATSQSATADDFPFAQLSAVAALFHPLDSGALGPRLSSLALLVESGTLALVLGALSARLEGGLAQIERLNGRCAAAIAAAAAGQQEDGGKCVPSAHFVSVATVVQEELASELMPLADVAQDWLIVLRVCSLVVGRQLLQQQQDQPDLLRQAVEFCRRFALCRAHLSDFQLSWAQHNNEQLCLDDENQHQQPQPHADAASSAPTAAAAAGADAKQQQHQLASDPFTSVHRARTWIASCIRVYLLCLDIGRSFEACIAAAASTTSSTSTSLTLQQSDVTAFVGEMQRGLWTVSSSPALGGSVHFLVRCLVTAIRFKSVGCLLSARTWTEEIEASLVGHGSDGPDVAAAGALPPQQPEHQPEPKSSASTPVVHSESDDVDAAQPSEGAESGGGGIISRCRRLDVLILLAEVVSGTLREVGQRTVDAVMHHVFIGVGWRHMDRRALLMRGGANTSRLLGIMTRNGAEWNARLVAPIVALLVERCSPIEDSTLFCDVIGAALGLPVSSAGSAAADGGTNNNEGENSIHSTFATHFSGGGNNSSSGGGGGGLPASVAAQTTAEFRRASIEPVVTKCLAFMLRDDAVERYATDSVFVGLLCLVVQAATSAHKAQLCELMDRLERLPLQQLLELNRATRYSVHLERPTRRIIVECSQRLAQGALPWMQTLGANIGAFVPTQVSWNVGTGAALSSIVRNGDLFGQGILAATGGLLPGRGGSSSAATRPHNIDINLTSSVVRKFEADGAPMDRDLVDQFLRIVYFRAEQAAAASGPWKRVLNAVTNLVFCTQTVPLDALVAIFRALGDVGVKSAAQQQQQQQQQVQRSNTGQQQRRGGAHSAPPPLSGNATAGAGSLQRLGGGAAATRAAAAEAKRLMAAQVLTSWLAMLRQRVVSYELSASSSSVSSAGPVWMVATDSTTAAASSLPLAESLLRVRRTTVELLESLGPHLLFAGRCFEDVSHGVASALCLLALVFHPASLAVTTKAKQQRHSGGGGGGGGGASSAATAAVKEDLERSAFLGTWLPLLCEAAMSRFSIEQATRIRAVELRAAIEETAARQSDSGGGENAATAVPWSLWLHDAETMSGALSRHYVRYLDEPAQMKKLAFAAQWIAQHERDIVGRSDHVAAFVETFAVAPSDGVGE